MKLNLRRACARLVMSGVAVGALWVGGCDRTYMTPSHGRAYRETFAAQTVNPDRQTEARAVHGLDSQEAAIISASYRKALSPKDEAAAANSGPMLMYAPRGGGQQNMPPPSVPGDR
jgi:hypothetical protein